jgi:sterol 3beta-glucosyltransferase
MTFVSHLVIEAAPHDWLFPQCSVVVHHGGAGTTAAGLRAGKPTVIVPFFGDQYFWGRTVAAMGLGPHPVPFSVFSSEKLAEAIKEASTVEIKAKAEEIAKGRIVTSSFLPFSFSSFLFLTSPFFHPYKRFLKRME